MDDAWDPWGSSFWAAVIALRREIHAHPESGFTEVETQKRIRKALISFAGIPESQIRTCAQTGLVVDILGTGPCTSRDESCVQCVALRADMDALTMTEDNENLPYRSKNKGLAHMCGHDGHMAALVGAAGLLQQRAKLIPEGKRVRLLFQPAEEGTPPGTGGYDFEITKGNGAPPMIQDGCLEGVDEVYGWHNWPAFPLGDLRVRVGPVMAHESSFEIVISGRGGHASQPHLCVDPVICGAHVVTALQTVVSRNVPSSENAVVSVTVFQGSERMNVIPQQVRLGGTIRDMGDPVASTIVKRMRKLVASICDSFGCSAEIQVDSMVPAVMNHASGVDVVNRVKERLPTPLTLQSSEVGLPMMAAEDFAFYLKERPGCFFFLGTSEPALRGLSSVPGLTGQQRSNCICHAVDYDFNDNVLPRAIAMFLLIVEDRLGAQLCSQTELMQVLDLPSSDIDVDPTPKRQRVD